MSVRATDATEWRCFFVERNFILETTGRFFDDARDACTVGTERK